MRCGLVLILTLIALGTSRGVADDEKPAPPPVGGDVDAHGCRPSAGYRWCEKTARCERPWELAKAKGFENTADGYKAFCQG